jgi:hypothetical protein
VCHIATASIYLDADGWYWLCVGTARQAAFADVCRSTPGRHHGGLLTDWHGLAPGTIQRMSPPESGLPGKIGAPATRTMIAAGYTELRKLANVPAAELRKLRGAGPKALKLLQEALVPAALGCKKTGPVS